MGKEKNLIGELKKFIENIKKGDNEINSFLQINKNALQEAEAIDKKIKQKRAGKLAGLAIAVKSMFFKRLEYEVKMEGSDCVVNFF